MTTWTTIENDMGTMHHPAHPGEILRELYLEPLGLSVTIAAAALGVTRRTLSEVVKGRSRVTPVMALRLERAFASSAEHWLRMQQNTICGTRVVPRGFPGSAG